MIDDGELDWKARGNPDFPLLSPPLRPFAIVMSLFRTTLPREYSLKLAPLSSGHRHPRR